MVLRGARGDRAPRALGHLLNALTEINVDWMRSLAGVGLPLPLLYSSGFRYQRENYKGPHPEDWRDCLEVVRRRGGDCEDLCAYRAAELRARFGEPAAKCAFVEVPRRSGRLFHIVVLRQNGAMEDPSRELGMGRE